MADTRAGHAGRHQTIDGLGSGPSAVDTGNSPVADAGRNGGGGLLLPLGVAGLAGVALAGVVVSRRSGASVRA